MGDVSKQPSSWRAVWQAFRTPVVPKSRRLLAEDWARLPTSLRTPHQMLGRQGNSCGATNGAMPRCDFACRGCYLGEEANRIPAESVDGIKAQMRALCPILGPARNLQLTDGEVTLRRPEEVIELLRYARTLDLIAMRMTHGDSVRRRGGLLERVERVISEPPARVPRAVARSPSGWQSPWYAVGATRIGAARRVPSRLVVVSTAPTSVRTRGRSRDRSARAASSGK